MKTNIAVLFGGKSVEHEISVISAVQAMAALDEGKFGICPVYIAKDGAFWYGQQLRDMARYKDIPALLSDCHRAEFTARDGKVYLFPTEQKAIGKTKPIALLDAALPIVHGTNVEDGALQGYLKTLGLPFAGCDVLASAVCMDKYVMKVMLRAGGFPVLDGLRIQAAQGLSTAEIIVLAESKFGYPLIVKPVNLGSSIGISKAADADTLTDALETAFSFADTVLIEPCVQNLREINCAVLGDSESAKPSECEEPVANDEGWLDYETKYVKGGKSGTKGGGKSGMASLSRKIPADITPETRQAIQDCAAGAFRYLDCCGVARIDFLMDGATGKFWLNELNTIPGSLAFYLWEPVGVKYGKLLEEMISLALKRARHQSEITYSFDTNILANQGAFGSKGKV
ncbi:MAG: D-alanine--D-alanine ligase [Oscillospiraceae bacterium]|jgi:D-alanine-D-alanine ligase|nr:D-alanine--D-alanine ligase [Oscillospiraceae bacterium]